MKFAHQALLFCFLAISSLPACAADYAVGGTVLNMAANSPMAGARVVFYPGSGSQAVASLIAGDDGRFRIQLPAGSYRMFAGTRDTWENYGARNSGDSLGSAVIVGAGKDTSNLTFRYFAPASVSGTVKDDVGEPVASALVQLTRSYIKGGAHATGVFAYQRTDDRGQYRFGGIPGDTAYYLAVTAEPWYNQTTLPGAAAAETAAAAYAARFYPNTGDPSGASTIIPKPGQDVRADFTMSTVPTATLSIHFEAPPGLRGSMAISSPGVAGIDSFQQSRQLAAVRGSDSTEVVKGIPPGRYLVRVAGVAAGVPVGAAVEANINGVDNSVSMVLKPFPKVSGTVHVLSGTAPVERLSVLLQDEITGAANAGPIQPDGTFSIRPSSAGRLRLRILNPGSSGPGGVYFPSGIEARGATFRKGTLVTTEGSDVTLSIGLSNQLGGVRGIVQEGDGPAEGVLVVLMPAVPDEMVADDVLYLGYQTESDGSFDFRMLHAGRYLLFAVNDSELEYTKPEAVKPFWGRATEVEIKAGVTQEQRLSLLNSPVR